MSLLKELLTETTLSRVHQHYTNEAIPVATLTAFRDEYTYEENVKRNRMLAAKIKNAGYGYVIVDGGWIETHGDEKVPVEEDSILVIGGENDNGKLKGLVKKWINAYDQDAALFKPEKSTIVNIITKNGEEYKLSDNFSIQQLEDGYTKLRGRRGSIFSFQKEGVPQAKRGGGKFSFKQESSYDLGWINKKRLIG